MASSMIKWSRDRHREESRAQQNDIPKEKNAVDMKRLGKGPLLAPEEGMGLIGTRILGYWVNR